MLTATYRYTLERDLGTLLDSEPKHVVICGLNPSTAGANRYDPTSRRTIAFTRREGGTRLTLINVYAARSTKPSGLRKFDDPIGPLNDETIVRLAKTADLLIAAWGKPPGKAAEKRAAEVLEMLREHGDVYRRSTHERGASTPSAVPAVRPGSHAAGASRSTTRMTVSERTAQMSTGTGTNGAIERIRQLVHEDACIDLVREDDARTQDAASEHGPEEALIEQSRRELLDHIGSQHKLTDGDRKRLREAVERLRDLRPSDTLKGLIRDVEIGIESTQHDESHAGWLITAAQHMVNHYERRNPPTESA